MNMTKTVRVAVGLLFCLYGLVLLAGFFAPYDPADQDRDHPFAPPTRIHFIDAQRRFHIRPFVYAWTNRPDSFAEYEEDRTRPLAVRFLASGADYRLLGFLTCSRHLFRVDEPGRLFLLGTDGYGRDQFSRLLWGGRISGNNIRD